MQFPIRARLAVVAVGTAAVGMSVVAPSYAASTPLTFAPVAKATAGVVNSYDITMAGAGCTATGCTTAGIPATATWTLSYKDPTTLKTVTIDSGPGNSLPAGYTKTHNFGAPPAGTYGAYKVALTFTNGSGTTKQTWYSYTNITYGTVTGKPVGPTAFTASTMTPVVNTAISFTISGGVWPQGASHTQYKIDMGMASGTPGNTQTVDAVAGAATLNFAGYTAAGTYIVKAYSFDGLNTSTAFQTLTLTVGTAAPGGGGTPPPAGTGPAVQRLGGTSRYDTGVVVSKQAFPTAGSAQNVIIATGAKFPDALSGVPLAKKLTAPLLLVDPTDPTGVGLANQEVKGEIARVLAAGGTVHVLGGESAVPTSLVTALTPAGAAPVDRIAGANRFETSVKIAGALGNPKNVVVARGDDGVNMTGFADALSAGPYAANVFGGGNGAVLLSNNNTLDPFVKGYLAGATSVQAVGGPARDAVAAGGVANVQTAIVGNDRWDTAAQVAAKFTTPATGGVAYGYKFPDALTGAAFLAVKNGPLVLTDSNNVPAPTTTGALQTLGHALGTQGTVWVFGGQAVITETARGQIATNSGGHLA